MNEILKACNVTKGSLYHHFPNGKEELLIACLQSLNEAITTDIQSIFGKYPSTIEASHAILEKLVMNLETEGTITGYTFSSIVSEMATVSEPVRNTCKNLYQNIQEIYHQKLIADGFSQESAASVSLMLTHLIY
ncbi:MAG: TetR/AcrR family transcriptional regulator [Lysinibacillus sp.]